MKPVLREIEPAVPGDFLNEKDMAHAPSLLVRLVIGPEGAEGADSFDLLVSTPDGVAQSIVGDAYRWGRHMLIVDRIDLDLVSRAVETALHRCEANTWEEVAAKIGRFAAWEFEDYQA